jgi:hypothetical protein
MFWKQDVSILRWKGERWPTLLCLLELTSIFGIQDNGQSKMNSNPRDITMSVICSVSCVFASNRLVVALSQQIHVFTFPSPAQRLFTIETRVNVLGLCEVSPFQTAERQLLMFPGHKIGSVQLVVRVYVVTASWWLWVCVILFSVLNFQFLSSLCSYV